MTIKDYILKEKLVSEEYFEEFYNTYGHITKISTLRLLAQDFLKRKNKEKGFNIHKYYKHFELKFPNIKELITKIELKNLLKNIIKDENIQNETVDNYLFNEQKSKLTKKILNELFNQHSHTRFFKEESLYKKIELNLNLKNIVDINKDIETIKETLKNKNEEYKIIYEEKQKKLNEIVNAENIESYYPLARSLKRNISAFLGPTNSGKTHTAIAKLKEAKKGIYLAPLRLLAREIYDDLIMSGIKVSLITGEEKIINPKATHVCSTIEMLDINEYYDVAVIDEIQFLGDKDRGNAWSRALIGLYANEIMVVGSTDSKFLIDNIVELCKDNIFHYEFNRLSPLDFLTKEIKIEELEKGDAIIGFSRKDIHKIAKELEIKHGKKVSLIYGALPPEVRLEESRRFNEGETEILVSTDAIGYGLNLNIKRILFSTVTKFDGENISKLPQTVFKQISGRAGRYGKVEQGYVGYISHFSNYDSELKKYNELAEEFNKPLSSIEKSYYFPEWNALNQLSMETNNTESMYNLLLSYLQLFENKNKLFEFKFDFLELTVNYLDTIENLDIHTKYKLMFAPVRESNFYFYEKCVNSVIKKEPYGNKLDVHLQKAKSLEDLEEISHNALLYMWMNQRFEEFFPDYEAVVEIYKDVSIMIMDILKEGY